VESSSNPRTTTRNKMTDHTTFFESVVVIYRSFKDSLSRCSEEFAAVFTNNSIDIAQLENIRDTLRSAIAPLELSSEELALYLPAETKGMTSMQKKIRKAAQTKINAKFNIIVAGALKLVSFVHQVVYIVFWHLKHLFLIYRLIKASSRRQLISCGIRSLMMGVNLHLY
jgi:hypothetical protein